MGRRLNQFLVLGGFAGVVTFSVLQFLKIPYVSNSVGITAPKISSSPIVIDQKPMTKDTFPIPQKPRDKYGEIANNMRISRSDLLELHKYFDIHRSQFPNYNN